MSVSDVIFLTVSEVTGTEISQLNAKTSISESAIGSKPHLRLLDLVMERFDLGYLDLAFAETDTIGDLTQSVAACMPVYFEAGSLPDSARVETTIFRWHPVSRAPTPKPESLRTALEDGPWKWSTQSRYSGAGLNSGHFFGLTESGATAETIYYGNGSDVPDDHVLFSLDVNLDNVLNLTRKDTIIRYFKECVDLEAELTYGEVAAWLIARTKGGNAITDYMGYRAYHDGYSGILFLGARAIPEIEHLALGNARPYDEQLNNDWESIRKLSRNADYINLVVFAGARLVTRTRRYRCGGVKRRFRGRDQGRWVDNIYFGWTEHDALGLATEFGADFQDARARGFFISKPRLTN